MAIHWIGIRDDQSVAAQRVWGQPDFWHMHHDWRSHGDIDWDHDIVIIGDSGTDTLLSGHGKTMSYINL